MNRWRVEVVTGAGSEVATRHEGVFEAETAWMAALAAARHGWFPDEAFTVTVKATTEPYTGLRT